MTNLSPFRIRLPLGARPRTGISSALLALLGLAFSSFSSEAKPPVDWLITPVTTPVTVRTNAGGNEITIANGLIARSFYISSNLGCISFKNLSNDAQFLRAVKPEARLKINGEWREIGGLKGQADFGYLDPRWLPHLTNNPDAFRLTGASTSQPAARYDWTPAYGAPSKPWPENGLILHLEFAPPDRAKELDGLRVTVHYEMVVGMPVLIKWLSVRNESDHAVSIDGFESEDLALTQDQAHRFHLESNYSFAAMNTTEETSDPEYTTRAGNNGPDLGAGSNGLLMKSRIPRGPNVQLEPGGEFESFRTFEILHDSDNAERRGLAQKRLYRTLAPQVGENPIFMHLRASDSASIRRAVDQCAEVGFEMIIISFWSGFDMNNEDPAYIARIKSDFDYAHSKGIKIGGYVLFCTTSSKGPEFDALDPASGKPAGSLCLGSVYSDSYFQRLYRFMDVTGMDVIETDGPYHGFLCASTGHKYHRGLDDSQWVNWQKQLSFFHECRKRGIFINAPDWYFLEGSNKIGMGYREDNWSLPRELQIVIARQNIYDGTWRKTPSMGWMMLPLVEYSGGGAAATLEPLSEHLREYGWHLAQNFGAGVQSCYRGPRLFDTDATEAVVKKWVSFYKAHRAILDSDFLHLRRPDGRDLDYILHVNPQLEEKGLLMVYNPLPEPVSRTLTLPLYYTGLTENASIQERDGRAQTIALGRQYRVELPVQVPADGVTWFLIK